MSSSVEIYEFSTGIYIEHFDDGSWRSRGFTGNWMHNTFGDQGIPAPIEQAIANKLFEVAEGDRSLGAVIGRVVKFTGDKEWSVIAIITNASDNFGRNLSVYRYFCCEGYESLITLIECLENYTQQHQQLPVFNPLNSRPTLAQYLHKSNHNFRQWQLNRQDKLELIYLKNNSIILNPNSCSLRQIHNLALKKADNVSAIAWAYNVQTLTRPESFLIIQPADQKAYHYLDYLLSNQARQFIAGIDEQGIKALIQELTNTDKISSRSGNKFKTIWLKSNVSSPQFLQQIFNSLGMDSVIKGNIHCVLVRVFELGSFLISDEIALLEYFSWRQQYYKGNVIETLKKFRKEIKLHLNDFILSDRSLQKRFINNSLKLLLEQKITALELFLLLTNEQESLWANKFTRDCLYDSIYSLIKNIDNLIQKQPINEGLLLVNSIGKPLYNYIKNIPSYYHNHRLKKIECRISTNNKNTYNYLSISLIHLYWLYLEKIWSNIRNEWYELQYIVSLQRNIPKPCKYYKALAALLGMLAKYDSKFAKLHTYFLYIIGSIRAPIYYSPMDSN